MHPSSSFSAMLEFTNCGSYTLYKNVDGRIFISECTQMCAIQSDTPCPNLDAPLIAGVDDDDDDDDDNGKVFTKICLFQHQHRHQ